MENLNIKEIIKLEQKKYREEYKQYLVYGEHIVVEAMQHQKLKQLIIAEDKAEEFFSKYAKYLDENKTKVIETTTKTLQKFKSVKTTPAYVGVVEIEENTVDSKSNILGINNISDPGNLGTMIRTARAFGINNIYLDDNTVDLYNPKVIQAIQGAQFAMNICKGNLFEFAQKSDLNIYTTFLDENSKDNLNEIKGKQPFLLIMGNESQGIEDKYRKLKRENIKLDIKYESLNVAIASGIIMYELINKGE